MWILRWWNSSQRWLKKLKIWKKKYIVLHSKVDVVVDIIKKLVDFNTNYSNKLEAKSEKDSQVFAKLEEFQFSIKESISKASLSNQSSVSQESSSQLISTIETNIKAELALIIELVLRLPMNIPHAR
ncbi:unnamed protein product [Lactuca virosa]|uniref:Uncharacterized protein n=1 Tax=Lactuca virosa TaxID=75947 RepID=A0AAU9M7D8_9ASTR|nr:unnamed protein product [Lactuca virosa]